MVSRLLLAANSTLVNVEHCLKACGDVQYRQGRCDQQQEVKRTMMMMTMVNNEARE